MNAELPSAWESLKIEPIALRASAPAGACFADLSREALESLLARCPLLILRGLAPLPTPESFSAACVQWGQLLEWDFGTVFQVRQRPDPQNYLFTSGSVPLHWDGAFAETVPWLQVFQCRDAPRSTLAEGGGQTTFSDTRRVWELACEATRSLWRRVEVSYETPKVAHYGGRIRVPLVSAHPLSGAPTLRFAEPADAETAPLNTPQLEVHGLPAGRSSEVFLAELREALYDPRCLYEHRWEVGDFVITDNYALLHGRRSYAASEARELWRVHVLHEAS